MRLDLAARGHLWLLVLRDLRAVLAAPGMLALRAASAVLVVAGIAVAQAWSGEFAAPGRYVLHWLVDVDAWLVVFCGIGLFPGLLTREREQGTWDLLCLAGCRPLDFLLARSAAMALAVLVLLGVQLPFALLAIALGGVDLEVVGHSAVLMLGHVAATWGAALLAVTGARSSAAVARRAVIAVTCVSFLPGWLAGFVSWLVPVFGASLQSPATVMVTWAGWLPMVALDNLLDGTTSPFAWGIAAAAAGFCAAAVAIASRRRRVASVEMQPTTVAVRFPMARPVAVLAATYVGLRSALAWAFGLVIGAWLVCAVRIGMRAGDGLEFFYLMYLQASIMRLHVTYVAARTTSLYASSGFAPLLALAGGGSWLTQLRRMRWRLLAVHSTLLAITAIAAATLHHFDGAYLFATRAWLMVVVADLIGETCGLVVRSGAAGISVMTVLVFERSLWLVPGFSGDAALPVVATLLVLLAVLWRVNRSLARHCAVR